MEQAAWRGMPCFDVFWRKRYLTRRELLKAYTNKYTYVFWALIISVLVLLDLHGFAERVSMAALVTYTVVLSSLTFLFYFLASLVGIKLSQRFSRFFLIFPLVGFVGAVLATYLVEIGMSAYFGGRISLEHAAEKLPINFILTLVLETFFLTFVMPVAVPSGGIGGAKPAGPETPCKTITIAGKTYYCKALISVSSQDHYVRIKTSEEEDMVRARLSDLIEKLSCQNGIQPHRSHWVSRRAVVGMVSRKGHKRLEICDGSEIPVARGRASEVQNWLDHTEH